jgi:hypothetical protein
MEVRMKKILLAGTAALVLAGSTAVYAQHRPWFHEHMRMSAEDRAAFADARIAAVHAGLKLNSDQEKLWPPVEAAVKEFARQHTDRANARMNAMREGDRHSRDRQPVDPVTRLRDGAEAMGATAAAMKKVADAADPLYKTLDDGQKRRLAILTRIDGRFGGGGGWRHRGFGRGFDGGDRGYDRDRGPGRDRDRDGDRPGGPERL